MILTKLYRCVVILFALGIVTFATAQSDKTQIINQIQEISLKSMAIPVDLGTMTMDSVKFSGNTMEYFSTIKEEKAYNYNRLNISELKQILLSSYSPDGANALSAMLCIDSNKEIKYHYYNTAGQCFTISFNHTQLLSALGLNEVTQEYREHFVESYLLKTTSPYKIGYKLHEINEEYLDAGLYVEYVLSKEEKKELLPNLSSIFLTKDITALLPLYALYLEKGYSFSVIDSKTKKGKPFEISYSKLSEIFEYINKPRREELYEDPIKRTVESENKDSQTLDVKPSFNGGDANQFARWVNTQLKWPDKILEYGIDGRVIVKFTIDKDGSVTNVKVINGIHPDIDEEAVRVVSSSPRWTPGSLEGEPVPVTYTFPIIVIHR